VADASAAAAAGGEAAVAELPADEAAGADEDGGAAGVVPEAAVSAGGEAAVPELPADEPAGADEDGGDAGVVPEAAVSAATTPCANASAPGTPGSVIDIEVELERMIDVEEEDDEVSLMHHWFTFVFYKLLLFYGA
jgi:hypothetical protein